MGVVNIATSPNMLCAISVLTVMGPKRIDCTVRLRVRLQL